MTKLERAVVRETSVNVPGSDKPIVVTLVAGGRSLELKMKGARNAIRVSFDRLWEMMNQPYNVTPAKEE